jgi:hypothetical protein
VLQILLLVIVRFDVARVSLWLSFESPDERYRIVTIEDTTDFLERQWSVGTLGLDDGEVQPDSLEY